MKYAAVASAVAILAAPIAASAKDKSWPELGVESKIPFAATGGIRNFRPDGDYGLWIEDSKRRWYYAALDGRCSGLGFASAVGFDTDGLSTFDRFGIVRVEGISCRVTSLVTAEKPATGKALKQLQDEVRALGRNAFADS